MGQTPLPHLTDELRKWAAGRDETAMVFAAPVGARGRPEDELDLHVCVVPGILVSSTVEPRRPGLHQ